MSSGWNEVKDDFLLVRADKENNRDCLMCDGAQEEWTNVNYLNWDGDSIFTTGMLYG